jgi:NADH dehydrogenase
MVRVRGDTVFPGVAPVAMQQGRYVAEVVRDRLALAQKEPFRYRDKGNLATIGRASGRRRYQGAEAERLLAWMTWLVVHLWYLVGFQNRLLVIVRWSFSFVTHGRGSRLITNLPSQVRERKASQIDARDRLGGDEDDQQGGAAAAAGDDAGSSR